MLKKVDIYWCDSTPQDNDINEILSLVNEKDIIVRVEWFVRYSGHYSFIADKDSTYESIKKQIPRIYGM